MAGRQYAICRIKRIRKREGRCYELAMRGYLRTLEWELVHCESNGHWGARKIGHARLEFDGEAYCPILDKAMPTGDFLRIVGLEDMPGIRQRMPSA